MKLANTNDINTLFGKGSDNVYKIHFYFIGNDFKEGILLNEIPKIDYNRFNTMEEMGSYIPEHLSEFTFEVFDFSSFLGASHIEVEGVTGAAGWNRENNILSVMLPYGDVYISISDNRE